MNKLALIAMAIMVLLTWSCKNGSDQFQIAAVPINELEPIAYTLYSEKSELFVEFKPLVVGSESKFAAHFTILGDLFLPYTEGNIILTLNINGKTITTKADAPSSPGIFRLILKPDVAGKGTLTFDIKTKEFADKIVIENVEVYSDQKTALVKQSKDGSDANVINYLKEQAWKVEFANEALKKTNFNNIISASGTLMSPLNSEQVLTSKISGIVSFANQDFVEGKSINAGAKLFYIKANEVTSGHLNEAVERAKNDVNTAKIQKDRATSLVADKLISQKEYNEAKLRYENANAVLSNVIIGKSYSHNNLSISSPMAGYLKNVTVKNGQYVEAGTPLATITKNKTLMLQAMLSQKYFDQLASIKSASFKLSNSNEWYETTKLNGKLIAYGKSVSSSLFLPVTFEIVNTKNLIPGSVVEVNLKSAEIKNVFVIPMTSLVEEQGNFYVYVQTEGESFQKREVKLGAKDGVNVQLLSGVNEGERVVTKGAYQIKLSTASGTLPAHGHEH